MVDDRDEGFAPAGDGDSGSERRSMAHDVPPRFDATDVSGKFDGASGLLFEQAMAQTRMAVCLTDPRQKDDPIVFSNRAFRKLTGYAEEAIVGRNCRFLQGPDTDPDALDRLRAALRGEEVAVVELLNYRKDGSRFWNALHLGPIYDAECTLLYYFGSQWDVTDVHTARSDERQARILARELSHRMKNMFSVIGAIVTMTGRSRGARDVSQAISERIQALGRAYDTTLDVPSDRHVDLAAAVRAVLAPYDPDGTRIAIGMETTRTDASVVSSVGLTLHELATNAVKYGALSRDGGTVSVSVENGADGALALSWRERGGPAVIPPDGTQGTGLGIVDRLLRVAGGRIDRSWDREGLTATIHLDGVVEA